MSIDRGIRARQLRPYSQGEGVPVPACDITEEGILSTSHRKGKITVEFAEKKDFPKSITLRARIVPIPLQNRSSQAQVIVNGRAMQGVPYYDVEAVRSGDEALAQFGSHEAIALRFTGSGMLEDRPFQGEEFQEFTLLLAPHQTIFEKEFQTQTAELLIQRQDKSSQDLWIVTPPDGSGPKNNVTPLLGYGGLYRPGLSLEKIVPVFAVLGFQGNVTCLKLYSLLALRQENILPPQGGMKGNSYWYFAENLTREQQNSLADSLQQGFARIMLQHRSTEERMTYHSKFWRQTNLQGEEVDITFMPPLNGERK